MFMLQLFTADMYLCISGISRAWRLAASSVPSKSWYIRRSVVCLSCAFVSMLLCTCLCPVHARAWARACARVCVCVCVCVCTPTTPSVHMCMDVSLCVCLCYMHTVLSIYHAYTSLASVSIGEADTWLHHLGFDLLWPGRTSKERLPLGQGVGDSWELSSILQRGTAWHIWCRKECSCTFHVTVKFARSLPWSWRLLILLLKRLLLSLSVATMVVALYQWRKFSDELWVRALEPCCCLCSSCRKFYNTSVNGELLLFFLSQTLCAQETVRSLWCCRCCLVILVGVCLEIYCAFLYVHVNVEALTDTNTMSLCCFLPRSGTVKETTLWVYSQMNFGLIECRCCCSCAGLLVSMMGWIMLSLYIPFVYLCVSRSTYQHVIFLKPSSLSTQHWRYGT